MKCLSLSICGFKYLWNTLGSSPQDGGVQWLLRHYCYKGMETWALLRKRERYACWTTEGRLSDFFRLKSSLLLFHVFYR